MRKLALLLTCSCILLLMGCSDEKTDALNDLEAITEEITTKSADYTQEDWDIAENQFGLICEELEQYEFTDEQLKHIGKLKGKCTAVFARKKASDFKIRFIGLVRKLKDSSKAYLEAWKKKEKSKIK